MLLKSPREAVENVFNSTMRPWTRFGPTFEAVAQQRLYPCDSKEFLLHLVACIQREVLEPISQQHADLWNLLTKDLFECSCSEALLRSSVEEFILSSGVD
jgi:hypothetical protein